MVIGSAAVNERTAKLTPSLLQDGIQGREFCFDRGGMGLSRTPPNGEMRFPCGPARDLGGRKAS
jgi:hypothetical protein